DEVIARTEADVVRSPQSVPLHQLLATYYRAAGRSDKTREALASLTRLRPDDAAFQFRLAEQLAEDGDAAGAVPFYSAAIARDPTLFWAQYSWIALVYRRAEKTDELVKLLERMDLKWLGSPSRLMSIIILLNRDDEVVALLRNAWNAFPNERPQFLAQLYRE